MSAAPFEAFHLPRGSPPPHEGGGAERTGWRGEAVPDAVRAGVAVGPHGEGPQREEDRGASRDGAGLPLRTLAVTPAWIASLADTLRAARARLRERKAAELVAALGRVGARFCEDAHPVRRRALELLPASAGISPETAAAVLDGMAADWREERLLRLLDEELGGPAALDGFVSRSGRECMAVGPALTVQIVAGSVPGVGVSALLRSLLVKSPTLLKPGRGDVVLPVLFARALSEEDERLADAVAVVYWPGGSAEVERAALARAEAVTAYGSDETVRRLRELTPVTARFVPYHHRISVAVVGREALEEGARERVAEAVALAAAVLDQRGCVSPRVLYVEEGGAVTPRDFAACLAAALDRLETRLPSGELARGEAAALQQARGTAELLAAAASAPPGVDTDAPRVLHGGPAPWTVVYAPAGAELAAGPGRFVGVRGVAEVTALPGVLAPLARHLQTVGYAGLGERAGAVAALLAPVGVTRVVPVRRMAFPPPWWHHDGGGPLFDLVRWVDLEREEGGAYSS